MLLRNLYILLVLLMAGCASPEYKNPHVQVQTKFGEIEIELYPDQAPKTTAAF